MKLNKYSWLAALPMIFTACQEDTLVKEQLQDDKIYTLSATMDGGVAMSRAQIQLGNEDASAGEIFMWNEKDEFALFQKLRDADGNDVLSTSVFTETNMSEDKKNATFTTENPATASKDYMAIYPSNLTLDAWKVQIKLQETLDFSSADTDEAKAEVWKDYMNNNMYMLAKGKIVSEGSNELNFEHLCALARVTYTNDTDEAQTIEELSFRGRQLFKTSIVYNLFSNKLEGGSATENYKITYEGGLTVKSGESIDLYAFLLPYNFNTNVKMQLYVKTNNVDKGVSMRVADIKAANPDDEGFKAGKRYWFKVTETKEGLKWNTPKPEIISDLSGFKNAMSDETVTQILLTNPIVIDKYVNLYNPNHKTISMSENFTWTVDGIEHNALFVDKLEESEVQFCNCTIEGSTDLANKYLFQIDKGSNLEFYNVDLCAQGNMNAVRACDSRVEMWDSSSIDVQDAENYAFYVTSDEAAAEVYLDGNDEEKPMIKGHLRYIDNFSTSLDSYSYLQFNCGEIDGNIITEGNNIQELRIYINGTYNGNKTIKVSTVDDLRNVVYNEAVETIYLMNPIIITENISLASNNSKTIMLDETFTWKVNDQEYDALFVNNAELDFENFTIVGSCGDIEAEKYILMTTAGYIFFSDGTLEANGNMNGVRVHCSSFSLSGDDSLLNVESEEKLALYISSEEEKAADVYISGTVSGDVVYKGNNYDSNKPDCFNVKWGCTLNGDLKEATGSVNEWLVTFDNESVVNGTGWTTWQN